MDDLHGQDRQLLNVKKMGLETNELMRAANKDLRDQRDVLVNVADRNQSIKKDLERGNKIISQMGWREFLYRIALHGTAFILMICIILVIVMKIVS